MSHQLVEDLQKKADRKVAVSQACRILAISRSGYYANLAAQKRRLAAPTVCAASVPLKPPLQPATRLTVAAGCEEKQWPGVVWPWVAIECVL